MNTTSDFNRPVEARDYKGEKVLGRFKMYTTTGGSTSSDVEWSMTLGVLIEIDDGSLQEFSATKVRFTDRY